MCLFVSFWSYFIFCLCRWTGTTVWKWQRYAKKDRALWNVSLSTAHQCFQHEEKKRSIRDHLGMITQNSQRGETCSQSHFCIFHRHWGVSCQGKVCWRSQILSLQCGAVGDFSKAIYITPLDPVPTRSNTYTNHTDTPKTEMLSRVDL